MGRCRNTLLGSTPWFGLMLGRPRCPNCGRRFLVARILTSGALFRPADRYYRCYRCFTVFSPADTTDGVE